MKYVIRLQRIGCKFRPRYNIVVQYDLKGIQSNPLAILGSYDILHNHYKLKQKHFNILKLNKELMDYWLSKGAKPTKLIQKLLFS